MKLTPLLIIIFLMTSELLGSENSVDFKPLYAKISAGAYSEAIASADSLLAHTKGQDKGVCYYIIGYSYEQQSEIGLAMENYLNALDFLEKQSTVLRVLNNIGNTLNSYNLHNEAIVYFNEIIENDFNDSLSLYSAFLNRGLSYSKLKQHEDAVTDIKQSIQLSLFSNNPRAKLQAINIAGRIFRDAGRDEESVAFHQSLLKMYDTASAGNKHYELYRFHARQGAHNLGRFYLLAGDTVQALHFYDKAIALSKTDNEFFESRKDVGEIYLHLGKVKASQAMLASALATGSDEFLLSKTDNLEIFNMLGVLTANPVQRAALFQKGTNLLLKYSHMRDRLVFLAEKHIISIRVNNHHETKMWEELVAFLSRSLVGVLSMILLVAAIVIFIVVKRNRKLANELDTIIDKMSPAESK